MTLSNTIGRNRAQAVYRILAAAIVISTGFLIPIVLGGLAVILAVVWHVVDVVWQLLFDSEALLPGRSMVRGYWEWVLNVHEWLLFGDQEFPWPV